MGLQRHSFTRRTRLRKRRLNLILCVFAGFIIAFVIRGIIHTVPYHTVRREGSNGVNPLFIGDKTPIKIDWQYPTGPSGDKTAALHSPFHITYGGGERYMLATAKVLQESGYKTDFLVTRDNVCNTTDHLLSVANGLRIVLDPKLTRLLAVDKFNYHFTTPLPRYVSLRIVQLHFTSRLTCMHYIRTFFGCWAMRKCHKHFQLV